MKENMVVWFSIAVLVVSTSIFKGIFNTESLLMTIVSWLLGFVVMLVTMFFTAVCSELYSSFKSKAKK